MTNKSKSISNDGINEWSRLYGRPITEDEYSEICQNLSGFVEILHQWHEQETTLPTTEK